MKVYKTTGPVRGSCGHKHRSIEAALVCLRRDQRNCARLGGGAYSDRAVRYADGAELDSVDLEELRDLEDRDR